MIHLYFGIGFGILFSQILILKKERRYIKDFIDAAATLTTGLVIIMAWPLCILLTMKFKK
ncbi:MAG: hypothetical protein JXR88_12480 [Clostridia bacterium]|nr:hypothetical protein [Clostridia bacterium]